MGSSCPEMESGLSGQGGACGWIWKQFRRQSTRLASWSDVRVGGTQEFNLGTEEDGYASNRNLEGEGC